MEKLNEITLGNWRVVVTAQLHGHENVVFPHQVHGDVIILAEECISGETEADGIVVSRSGFKTGVDTADCMPLVILSENKGIVLHVSRKTLIRGLLEKVPDVLLVSDITNVFIGPHICKKHFVFEFEGEELKEFQQKFPAAYEKGELIHLSLVEAVTDYFKKWQVKESIITGDNRCTFEDLNLISYRRWLERNKQGAFKPGVMTIIERVN